MNNANQHIPAGYKSSPLGIIPENWEVKRLGEIAEIGSGGTPSKGHSEYWNGNIPWITTSLLNNPYIETAEEYITEEGLNNSSAKMLNEGVLLMAMYGQGQTRGKVSKLLIRASTNQACAYIDVHTGLVDYIHQNLIANYESIRNESNDGNQKNLSLGIISNIRISFPPFPEQQRIVSLLSFWDTAISKQTQLVEKLTLRKRGLMQQLLTGEKRLKGFEGKWCIHKIREHFIEIRDKNDGKGHIPMSISAKLGLVPQTDKFDRVVAGNSLDKYTLLRKGDFAYNKGNSNLYEMGCIYRLQEESAVVPFVYICFRVIDDTSCDFFQQFFINHGLDKQLKQIISSGARGDGLLNVNVEDFMSLKIPYPTIEEQNAIASILMQADKEIELAKQKLSSLQEQKKGLMQELLTGKRRVK